MSSMWLKVQHPRQGIVFPSSVLFKVARIKVILFLFFLILFYLIFKHIDGSVLPPRSLTVVTEQMEQFSSHLGELCSFSVMQDRLAEQQKAAVEERAFLKDIISRMHTQLREQERQLEKVRTELLLALAWCFRVTPQHGGKHTNLFLCFRNAGRQQQKRPRWSRSKEAWRKSGAPSAKRERSWKELR